MTIQTEGIPIKTPKTRGPESFFEQNYNKLTKGAIFLPFFGVIIILVIAFLYHHSVPDPLGRASFALICWTVLMIILEVCCIGFTIANYKYLAKKGIYPHHRKIWLIFVLTYEAIIVAAILFISIRWGAL